MRCGSRTVAARSNAGSVGVSGFCFNPPCRRPDWTRQSERLWSVSEESGAARHGTCPLAGQCGLHGEPRRWTSWSDWSLQISGSRKCNHESRYRKDLLRDGKCD
ncbi:hypothetical protein RRG08_038260 [Elysia crispata]|uniref:Uncharacterized protein n=1 Tax=Elysia crispata TaxID=231223 RepID=A0AAE1E1F4_9GAST|nr:hypothetical protein RRG08_038260 [Elysia crispata]